MRRISHIYFPEQEWYTVRDMENLLKAIVIILFLYAIGKLSRKNEIRVEKAINRLVALFKGKNAKISGQETFDLFCQHYNISQREKDVIELICAGKSNKEIEDELFISLQTVKDHTHRIYQKTGVKNRIQLSNLVRDFSKQRN